MKFRMTLLATSFAMLAACGGDKIDGSTEAKFASSMNEISQNIEIGKKADFDNAIAFIGTQFGHDRAGFAKALDGKSADAVVTLSAEMRKAAHEKALEQAKQELATQIKDEQTKLDEMKAKLEQEQAKRAVSDHKDQPEKLEQLIGEAVEVHTWKIGELKKITPEEYLAKKQ
jgi:hypothetical protein